MEGRRRIFQGLARVEVINLVRRPDRLTAFRDEVSSVLGRAAVDSICVRPGVDGLCLAPTAELEELFAGNSFGNRRAVLACALSHALAWADAAAADGPVLVFEDDIRLAPAFSSILQRALVEAEERFPAWDLVLLGYHPTNNVFEDLPPSARHLSPMRWHLYWGGLFGYLVSPGGATRLLELVEAHGFPHEVDMGLIGWRDQLLALETTPRVVFSTPVHKHVGAEGDTDIQHDRSDLWFR